MKSIQIEIDEEVYAAIEQNARGLNQKPNNILRRVFQMEPISGKAPSLKRAATGGLLDAYLQSDEYLKISTADEKYLCLVGWLFRSHPKLKESLHNFSLRTRILFSKDRKTIEGSAEGGVVKPIPDVEFFAMVTLDNRSKRKIITKVLVMSGYDDPQIQRVLKTLPDSGIRRGNNSFLHELLAPLAAQSS